MALSGLLDIELSVPNPSELAEFWGRRGMRASSAGVMGTDDRDVQLRIVEGAYRHMSELHLGCDTEQDLLDISTRVRTLGVEATVTGTTLTCIDPVFNHRVVIDVAVPHPLTPTQLRALNPPGEQNRVGTRADAVLEDAPRTPRRLGHIVMGTPRFKEATAFFVDGLGFKISDQMMKGVATFARIEQDHHNLLIHPGPTSYINHYAMEMDDIDAIGKAGQAVLGERNDASVVGVGRHVLGSNVFWYMLDPSGTMFEFFTDIDQIIDDEAWERDHARRDWTPDTAPFSVWGPKEPEIFFNPPDLGEIAAGRQAAGLQ
ncbi:MAG: catechol 2,3-dioxygenase-like lactoylglutathione lyase family enzyme [Acidimicrobiales bacterium]|jgi:catechol 2,3-dioxygenase-like lactoylglutathione lyase family enzyme